VLVGGSTTGTTMAAVPLAEQAGTPFISLAGAVPIVEPTKKWVLQDAAHRPHGLREDLRDTQARKLTKVALISGSGGFDKSMRAEVREGRAQVRRGPRGRRNLRRHRHRHDRRSSPRSRAAARRRCSTPASARGPAIVTRNYRQVGLTLPLYQSHGVASREFIKLAGPAAKACACRRPPCWCRTSCPAGDRRSRW
jgi:branched-chain amino acid transport system substrate-binding protein